MIIGCLAIICPVCGRTPCLELELAALDDDDGEDESLSTEPDGKLCEPRFQSPLNEDWAGIFALLAFSAGILLFLAGVVAALFACLAGVSSATLEAGALFVAAFVCSAGVVFWLAAGAFPSLVPLFGWLFTALLTALTELEVMLRDIELANKLTLVVLDELLLLVGVRVISILPSLPT